MIEYNSYPFLYAVTPCFPEFVVIWLQPVTLRAMGIIHQWHEMTVIISRKSSLERGLY
jgi:hypothetical protein